MQAARDTLLAHLEEAKTDKVKLESRVTSLIEEVDTKEKQLLEAAMKVKRMMEKKLVTDRDLQLRTQQVYELRACLTATPPSPLATTTSGVFLDLVHFRPTASLDFISGYRSGCQREEVTRGNDVGEEDDGADVGGRLLAAQNTTGV